MQFKKYYRSLKNKVITVYFRVYDFPVKYRPKSETRI